MPFRLDIAGTEHRGKVLRDSPRISPALDRSSSSTSPPRRSGLLHWVACRASTCAWLRASPVRVVATLRVAGRCSVDNQLPAAVVSSLGLTAAFTTNLHA